jgi:outer membrane protein OmpA-like peptidoglycan-associated protein
MQLQKESEFKDTWVFHGLLDKDKNPPKEPVVIKEEPKEPEPLPMDTATVSEPPIEVTEVTSDSVVIATNVTEKTPPAIPVFDPNMVVRGKLIRFVIEGPDGKIIPGNVHHVDYDRGRDLSTFKSGEYLDVLPPPTLNNPMTIVCAIFGYKEVVQVIDYDKPGETPGIVRDENGAWVIPYKLEPLNTGDVSVMYRVAFYKDAVVMLPAAKGELDQLVQMMVSNPGYKIKIHGHCNGNNSRRIIALGAEQNFFNMAGSNEIKGSAKDLSRLRAETVQIYLADHGVDKSRSEIYSWGGQNMLVKETSTSAKLNDRIEIEILED